MKKGDILEFKKVKWVITDIKVSMAGITYYKYKVYRKYFKIWLNNTKCTYHISSTRWKCFKKKLIKNKNFHYTQILFTETL